MSGRAEEPELEDVMLQLFLWCVLPGHRDARERVASTKVARAHDIFGDLQSAVRPHQTTQHPVTVLRPHVSAGSDWSDT